MPVGDKSSPSPSELTWGPDGQVLGLAHCDTEVSSLHMPQTVLTLPLLTLFHPYKHLMIFYFAEVIKAQGLSNFPKVTGIGNDKAGI